MSKFSQSAGAFWRRHPESNQGIKDLQSSALPLGYAAMVKRWLTLSYKAVYWKIKPLITKN